MELKKIIFSVTVAVIIFLLLFSASLFLFLSDHKKDSSIYYSQGLEYYRKGDFQNAYYNFSKILPASPLFLNALFKQAKSADELGDYKTALKKYSMLEKMIKNKYVSPFILWRLSKINFDTENKSRAEKYLLKLRKEYTETEYGIASNYLLSEITQNSELKKEYLLDYIKYSPKGRFAKEVLYELLSNEKINTDPLQKIIIAKALYENGAYNRSIGILKDVPFNLSWVYMVKSLDKLNSSKNLIRVAKKGFETDNSNFDEDTLSDIVSIYLRHSGANLTSVDEIYSISKDTRLKGIALYYSSFYTDTNESLRRKIKLYEKYPYSKYSSKVLFDLFIEAVKSEKIVLALKYGKNHLLKFRNNTETPAVLYFVTLLKKKTQDIESKETLNRLITEYPTNYYTYRAYSTLINPRFSNKRDTKISSNKSYIPCPCADDKKAAAFLENFANERDFESLEDFRIQDGLIRSWIEYKKGNRALSSVLARDYINGLDYPEKAGNTAYRLLYPIYYSKEINFEAEKRNLSPYLILSLIKEESHFNPKISSAAGAAGLMQIMPSTANMISGRNFSAEELTDEELNIKLGTKYFEYLMKEFSNNEALCVLSYNSGPNAVKKWLKTHDSLPFDVMVENIPYRETKDYIKKVYTAFWNYFLTYEKVKI